MPQAKDDSHSNQATEGYEQMNKKKFCSVIRNVQKINEHGDQLVKMGFKENSDIVHAVWESANMISHALRNAVGDEEELIAWWLSETDHTLNTECVETPEKLYDLINGD